MYSCITATVLALQDRTAVYFAYGQDVSKYCSGMYGSEGPDLRSIMDSGLGTFRRVLYKKGDRNTVRVLLYLDVAKTGVLKEI